MSLSTHILDTTRGRPAAAVGVTLEREEHGGWRSVGVGTTDPDGRVRGGGAEGWERTPMAQELARRRW